ncbi:nucleoside triphosphate pyrophosphohydrolase [Hymenobacter sp. BT635]|uniref:Nucleoside triphosphate pyrophosphohydrolase n=1 Tax=Hymenobacter nitidus TaxID=2880929 RepID=A0ABS8AK74_9BACT|nr:nucleoside triphosphate pyrophosphohydrolase [Hymenobacter nitidus]MCB2380362.1 nucleoside triphosphate pyrophosphohydrolase [Hymenobacter nitidus]
MEYPKLIRDLIPSIIAASGRNCETRILDGPEYVEALREKLVEEACEAKAASATELATELADVLEVIDALLEAHGLQMEQVQQLQAARRSERGGFANRLLLLRIDD